MLEEVEKWIFITNRTKIKKMRKKNVFHLVNFGKSITFADEISISSKEILFFAS